MLLTACPEWLANSVNIASQTLDWLVLNFKEYKCSTSMFSEEREFTFFVDYVAECLKEPMLNDTALAIQHLDEACTDIIGKLPTDKQSEFSYRVLRMMSHLDKALTKYGEIYKNMSEEQLQLLSERHQERNKQKLVG
ncbi:hypothetical protein U2F10_05340 [Leptothoe sp. EHU-05/26/07-4]